MQQRGDRWPECSARPVPPARTSLCTPPAASTPQAPVPSGAPIPRWALFEASLSAIQESGAGSRQRRSCARPCRLPGTFAINSAVTTHNQVSRRTSTLELVLRLSAVRGGRAGQASAAGPIPPRRGVVIHLRDCLLARLSVPPRPARRSRGSCRRRCGRGRRRARARSRTAGLTRASRRVTPACSVSSRISPIFADPCESMKSMPSQSSTIPVMPGVDKRDLADPVLEGVRGGEEQAAVQPQDHDARGTARRLGARPAPGRPACPAPVPAGACGGASRPR